MDPRDDRTYTEALLAYLRHGHRAMGDEHRRTLEVRAVGSHTDAAGGYLLPHSWTERVRRKLAESWLLKRARRVRSSHYFHGVNVSLPSLGMTAQDGGDGSTAVPEVSPVFDGFLLRTYNEEDPGRGPLELRDMPALVKVSRRLWEDAATVEDLGTILADVFAGSVSATLQAQFITGTHSSTTVMGLKQSATITAGRAINAASATQVRWADLAKLVEALSPAYYEGAAWVFNPRALGDFLGSGGASGYLGGPDGPMLNGLPVHLTAALDVPATGAKKSVALVRLDNYTIAENLEGLTISRLEEPFAATGQLGFLLHYRVDACIDDPQAFALLNHV